MSTVCQLRLKWFFHGCAEHDKACKDLFDSKLFTVIGLVLLVGTAVLATTSRLYTKRIFASRGVFATEDYPLFLKVPAAR